MLIYLIPISISLLGMFLCNATYTRDGRRSLQLTRTQLIVNAEGAQLKVARFFLFVLSVIPIVVFSAIRYRVGTDYYDIYWTGYIVVSNNHDTIPGASVSLEKGLQYLFRVLQLFSESPVIFFVLTSIVIYILLYNAIVQESVAPVLSLVLFFSSGLYFTSLNVIRQFVVIACGLAMYPWIYQRKIIPYMLVVLILFFLHQSALLLILIYFLYSIRINPRGAILVYIVCLLGSSVIQSLFFLVLRVTRYAYYLNSSIFVHDIDISGLAYAGMIFVLASFEYKPLLRKYGQKGQFYFNLLVCFGAIAIMSIFLELTHRISLFFRVPVFIFTLPAVLLSVKDKRWRLALAVGILILSIAGTYYMYSVLGNSNVLPYQTIFQAH